MRIRSESVHIGIKGKERICVVQRTEELPAYFIHASFIELEVVPWLGVREHVPSQCIRSVFIQSLERINCVPEPLAHLVSVLIEYKAVGNHSLECTGAAHHRMNGMQGIEPSSGLVHSLRDEVRGTAELRASEIPQPLLRIRHGAGIEPDIDKVRFPDHLFPAVGDKIYSVYIRTVQVYPVIIFL